ncbi:uncharacterized protein PFLUO_LOCUS4910 [Penicillium psychrofluorescens]|uniref:uncharacterized protein n=1 Tax=Penicillium psychrofluorescens TaxID=3158075 RepID=UPI003CCDF448
MAASDMPVGFWVLMSVIAGILFLALACLLLKVCLRPLYYAAVAAATPQTALTHDWLKKRENGNVLVEAEDPDKAKEPDNLAPHDDIQLVPLPPGWRVPKPPPAWIRPPAAAAEGRREAVKALAGLGGAIAKKAVGDDS